MITKAEKLLLNHKTIFALRNFINKVFKNQKTKPADKTKVYLVFPNFFINRICQGKNRFVEKKYLLGIFGCNRLKSRFQSA